MRASKRLCEGFLAGLGLKSPAAFPESGLRSESGSHWRIPTGWDQWHRYGSAFSDQALRVWRSSVSRSIVIVGLEGANRTDTRRVGISWRSRLAGCDCYALWAQQTGQCDVEVCDMTVTLFEGREGCRIVAVLRVRRYDLLQDFVLQETHGNFPS